MATGYGRGAAGFPTRASGDHPLPFDALFLSDLVGTGVHSTPNKVVQAWADCIAMKYVVRFKEECLDVPPLYWALMDYIGRTRDEWRSNVGRVVSKSMQLSDGVEPSAAGDLDEQVRTRVGMLMRAIISDPGLQVPGSDMSHGSSEQQYIHQTVYRLILTVLLDLQTKPQGHFHTILGGPPVHPTLQEQASPMTKTRSSKQEHQKNFSANQKNSNATERSRSEEQDTDWAENDEHEPIITTRSSLVGRKRLHQRSRMADFVDEDEDADFESVPRRSMQKSTRVKNKPTLFPNGAPPENAINIDSDASDEIVVAPRVSKGEAAKTKKRVSFGVDPGCITDHEAIAAFLEIGETAAENAKRAPEKFRAAVNEEYKKVKDELEAQRRENCRLQGELRARENEVQAKTAENAELRRQIKALEPQSSG
ncbi:hypothetical protein Tdes44962_MAKER04879 [Teratosphaeria destructans]|uniref:Uncharacterized protein n=1 Tax=Teratosphaeria destructans TaxID=418781 RepID=A0A9W7VZT6_9PEZI|nr:hypothetical protein Tdes44962_MAKER04879 [Teratosphaeria destructans]